MIQILHDLLSASLPEDKALGKAYINLGRIVAGMAGNIVSPHATTEGLVRTVTPSEVIIDCLSSVIGNRGKLTIISTGDPVNLLTVPGFETEVAQFYTDIPAFLSLGAQPLLYGPGSIHTAHTDHEHITKTDIEQAITGYITIFQSLERQ
jgi:acetylornithine deacetylase